MLFRKGASLWPLLQCSTRRQAFSEGNVPVLRKGFFRRTGAPQTSGDVEDSGRGGGRSEEEEQEDIEIVEGRIEAFKLCASRLRELGWLGRFEEAFTEMLYVRIDSHVKQTCEDEFEDRMLNEIEHLDGEQYIFLAEHFI